MLLTVEPSELQPFLSIFFSAGRGGGEGEPFEFSSYYNPNNWQVHDAEPRINIGLLNKSTNYLKALML